MKTILVTGSAGFIGANLVMRLLRTPDQVGSDVKSVGGDGGLTIVGLDNMNDYYDVSLKEYRLRQIDALYSTVSSCPPPEVSSCPAPTVLDFVQILQEELLAAGVLPPDYDFEAHKQLVPMQPGDVPTTYADASALERDFGFTPKIPLREGLRKFAQWYKEYYG